MKSCPQCKSDVFDDMSRCFECLYDFDAPQRGLAAPGLGLRDIETVCVPSRTARYLKVIDPAGRQRQLPLSDKPLLVGRSARADVCIDDPTVSRDHLRIYQSDGKIVAEDRQASNPTLIDGIPLVGCVEITEENRIEVRGTILILTSRTF